MVHVIFSKLRSTDRFRVKRPEAFSVTPGKPGITFSSRGLDRQVPCATVSHDGMASLQSGATLGELVEQSRSTRTAEIDETRHMLAMGILEGSLTIDPECN
jgi:hypothetical protein